MARIGESACELPKSRESTLTLSDHAIYIFTAADLSTVDEREEVGESQWTRAERRPHETSEGGSVSHRSESRQRLTQS